MEKDIIEIDGKRYGRDDLKKIMKSLPGIKSSNPYLPGTSSYIISGTHTVNVGKGHGMKKRGNGQRISIGTLAAAVMLTTAGCNSTGEGIIYQEGFVEEENINPCVYGPPEEMGVYEESSDDAGAAEQEQENSRAYEGPHPGELPSPHS